MDIRSAVIVGGSLGGLSTALALSRVGIASAVLERTARHTQRGVAIRAAGAPLGRAIGTTAYQHVAEVLGDAAIRQGTLPHAWWDVYTALRVAADADPAIRIVEGAKVVKVGEDSNTGWARCVTGKIWRGDLLIGANGYGSVVRHYVAPDQRHAAYAGYIAWLGQSEISEAWQRRDRGVDFFPYDQELLVVYPLIDKSMRGKRFGWAWFDAGYNALTQEIGVVKDGHVMHTPRVDAIPDTIYASLIERAELLWNEPWCSGIMQALQRREVIATPISEYIPEQVVRGRVALMGDAAHA
jgi:2-polyprenyl-6-methoxyphenol hydroxylase-like FAD-dependent oxidoreductase